MLSFIEGYIVAFSQLVPVEVFILVGSFLEDIIAPIPSPLVTTLAGTIAQTLSYGVVGLIVLAVLASLGKTIGSLVLYILADKAEDFLLLKLGPKIGVSHKDVEHVGRYFSGSSKDYVILTVARALPIIPSLFLSVAAGMIKMPRRLYVIATFIGSFIRSALFIGIGFAGLTALQSIALYLEDIESVVQILIVLGFIGLLVWIWYRKVCGQRD